MTFHCSGQRDSLSSLQNNIPGEPNVDYPIYTIPPVTGFECNGRVSRICKADITILWQESSLFCFQTNGYYADTLSGCQSFHYCGHSSSVFGNIKWVCTRDKKTPLGRQICFLNFWAVKRRSEASIVSVFTQPWALSFTTSNRDRHYYLFYHQCHNFSFNSFEHLWFRYTSLCPNGTVFNQELFICDWWYRVREELGKMEGLISTRMWTIYIYFGGRSTAKFVTYNCTNFLLQVDCGLAESFYRLNDNIEAFADVTDQEIEKPFLQSYLEDDQDRSSYDLTAKESFQVW